MWLPPLLLVHDRYTGLGVGGNWRFAVVYATPPASQYCIGLLHQGGAGWWLKTIKLLVVWSTTNPIFLFHLKQEFLSLDRLTQVTSLSLPDFSIFEYIGDIASCSWVCSAQSHWSVPLPFPSHSFHHYTGLGVGGNQRFTVVYATPPASQYCIGLGRHGIMPGGEETVEMMVVGSVDGAMPGNAPEDICMECSVLWSPGCVILHNGYKMQKTHAIPHDKPHNIRPQNFYFYFVCRRCRQVPIMEWGLLYDE
jgi:hypothetical protein